VSRNDDRQAVGARLVFLPFKEGYAGWRESVNDLLTQKNDGGPSTISSLGALDPADVSRSRGAIVVGFVVLMVSGESTNGRVELVAEGRPMLRIKNVGIDDFPKSERLHLS
jgi:hypothetical protein